MSTVHFSFDLETWHDADWIGDPEVVDGPPSECELRDVVVRRVVRGSVEYLEAPVWITDGATTTRQTARMLLDTSDGDEAVDLPGQGYPVYIRVTDASEIAIVQAGSLELVG